jgi:hypothetical protein
MHISTYVGRMCIMNIQMFQAAPDVVIVDSLFHRRNGLLGAGAHVIRMGFEA